MNYNYIFFSITYSRYRDKEQRTSPTTTIKSASHSTVAAEKRTGAIAKVQTKQPQGSGAAAAAAKVTNKKIDMGAASNFGKKDLGINSPTHRNTHAEEDLFDSPSPPPPSSIMVNNNNRSNINNTINNNNNNHQDDLFKTCSNASSPTTTRTDDFDFNPREDENEFGDFASAFGTTTKANSNLVKPVATSAFADFDVSFDTSLAAPTSVPLNANSTSSSLLFDAAPPLMFGGMQQQNSLAGLMSPQQADLLSDFGGLNMNSPALSGKFLVFV